MTARRKPVLVQMGVDEIHLGKKQKFITVLSNHGRAGLIWVGAEERNAG
ncbi:MAG TPA: hypothetical protein VKV17_01660 [Bryobacteraceae bacterium]|nr:hypothetical protein [Bryobacteraceae bacterium]